MLIFEVGGNIPSSGYNIIYIRPYFDKNINNGSKNGLKAINATLQLCEYSTCEGGITSVVYSLTNGCEITLK